MEPDPYHFEFGPPAYVLWHGYKWYYYHRTGYYRDATTRGLHVAIWEHFHQRRVPPGHDVHHMDENKINNAPGNLELKEHGKHVGDHNSEDGRGFAGWTTEQFSESAKASWPRPEREFTCQQCGGIGRSSGQTPRYCSDECRKLGILARQEDLAGQYARTTTDPGHPVWSDPKAREYACTVCSVIYRTLATRSKYCSPECLAKAMAQRRWTRTCEECHAEFDTTSKNARFCPECRPKRNAAAQKASWAERKVRSHICEHCSRPYESTSQRSKYCTIKCGDAARLERRIADQMSRA